MGNKTKNGRMRRREYKERTAKRGQLQSVIDTAWQRGYATYMAVSPDTKPEHIIQHGPVARASQVIVGSYLYLLPRPEPQAGMDYNEVLRDPNKVIGAVMSKKPPVVGKGTNVSCLLAEEDCLAVQTRGYGKTRIGYNWAGNFFRDLKPAARNG